MALNRLMHPRNPYKNSKPNFKALAEKYNIMQKYSGTAGKVYLDFKNPECLRALTWTLLKEDFNLDILMPSDRLIPTVPLRLNYILWLEDLLVSLPKKSISGIDIGTGSSAIYALLGSRKNKWHFLATEADATNVEIALKNVERNELQNFVEVRSVPESMLLTDVLTEADGHFDFCMCNPPFFGSSMEAWGMVNNRNSNRPGPKSSSTASPQESIYPGGEVQFVKQLIAESLQLKDQIRIYTTMLGKKSSLTILKAELQRQGIANFGTTEFCQGRTMRWGLGWSFDASVTFPPSVRKQLLKDKTIPPLVYNVPKQLQCTEYTLDKIKNFILQSLQDIQMPTELIRNDSNDLSFFIMPTENTWSHQRRKRRHEMKLAKQIEKRTSQSEEMTYPIEKMVTDSITQQDEDNTDVTLSVMETRNDTKASQDDKSADVMSSVKKVCVNMTSVIDTSKEKEQLLLGDDCSFASSGPQKFTTTCSSVVASTSVTGTPKLLDISDHSDFTDDKECLFTSHVRVKSNDCNITVEMQWIEGKNRELMYQVMQYIKNKLK